MNYTITDRGVVYTIEPPADLPEITTAEAVAEMERISRQLEAALNPANVKPSEDQKARMWSRIYDAAPTVNGDNHD